MQYIALTFIIYKEDEFYVSECLELGTSSFGASEDEAAENIKDATLLYLSTLRELGEEREVLEEKGVKIHSTKPSLLSIYKAQFPVGSLVRPTVIDIEPVAS
ncbi:MAG: hypothetical protein KIS85_09475 [Anaerolineales bacterium]|nr:hypothetical protein [Anaerolineales bacterium]